jgi:hypothetical protein
VEKRDGPVPHRTEDQSRARSTQRSNGAVWKGDEGETLAETGDGYRVRFTNGFMAETIKEHRIKEA